MTVSKISQPRFARLGLAAAMVGAVALPAAPAAAASKTERAIIGALLGGFAGAAVSKGDGEAVAVGAVAGAALGAATAKSHDNRRYSRAYRTSRPAYSDARYGRDSRYYGDRYDRYDARYDYRR